jgi:hypothetical protein
MNGIHDTGGMLRSGPDWSRKKRARVSRALGGAVLALSFAMRAKGKLGFSRYYL